MSDSTGETKPPAFFCPKCGQKHRADLAPLRGRPGASVQVACRACQVKFRVRLDGERPVCDALPEADGAAPKAAIPKVVPPKVVPPKAAPPKVVPPKAAIPKVVPPKVVPPKVVPPEAVPPEAVPPKAVSPPPAPVPPRPAPPTPETAFAEGEKVGRYTVRGLLQHGDTSTVYRAHDPKTKRSVALKVLRADAPASVRRRFLRQVHVQANIRHQNVMPVYDREELPDGRPIFTMELVHQPHTLAGLLEDRASGKLATARKLAPLAEIEGLIEHVLLPIAEGVYVANVENGVIHGDLRPANVLVDGRTLRPYLMDFGRSGALEDAAGVDAREDSPYLAPEQRRGEENPRTDVWGLGALLHVILTGQAPRARLTGQAPRADAEEMYSLDVPPALAAIAQKAMAEEPDARYVNARQFATDLKAWRKGGRVWALEEYAGPVTTAEDKRRALKRYLQTALWIGAGLLVGTLVGSRIQIGGEDAYVIHAADAEAAVNRLDEAIERLGPEASSLEPEDAYGIWASLQARADDILTRLRKAPPSAGRDAMEERVAFVRGRIAPLPVAVEVPEGTHVRYANAVSGTPWTPPPGNRTRLPPGRWNVEVGDAYRFPVAIPLRVRKAGEDPATEAVVATWTIPVDPDDLPATYALVIGRPVRLAGPPQTAALAMRRVSTFAIDRRKVTCADYAHFLAALPAKERDASVPTTGFEKDATGTWVPGTGSADRPLTGVRPLDAERFATWRSAREGATLRLPTEAEWLLASDSPLFEWSRGDLAPAVDDRTRALPSLLAPPREMMIRSTAGDETPAVVARGRVRAEMPLGEALNEAVVLSATSPAPATGFRLVRAFP